MNIFSNNETVIDFSICLSARFPQVTQINYEGSNHRQSNYDGTPEGTFLQMNKNTNISTQNNYLRNGDYAKQLNLDSHEIQNNQIEHGMAEQFSIYSNGTSIRRTVGRWKFYGN
ncbi:hypothetical protein PVAND_017424 [Polypedilum vanderplanki]|uniref:Uncharacterized protein n=1 Tax=Polypedilum vanderplanki TaxID=319348 RepID=A0A9J6BI16_POLVA|nr:hypothetical protein PVAND_017424 [Polypedilum vanderplanki]